MCCTKPFFAFATERERTKILAYLKANKLPVKEKDMFQVFKSDTATGVKTYLISKKRDGTCLFLGKDKACTIQEVKPLDCLNWPLTFDFLPATNELIIHLGDCLFVSEMKKANLLDKWVADEKETLLKNLNQYSKFELIAYSSMPSVPTISIVDRITILPTKPSS